MWGGRVTYRLRRVEGTLRMSYKKVVLVDKDKPLPTLGLPDLMSIEFGWDAPINVAGIGPVVESEFAQVSVNFDDEGNSPRLRLEDLRTGRVRFLDALELETIVWLPARTAGRRCSTRPPTVGEATNETRRDRRTGPHRRRHLRWQPARRCEPKTSRPRSSRRRWRAAASTPAASRTWSSRSRTPTPRRRASGAGWRCTRTSPSRYPACRSTADAEAACRP